MRTYATYRVRWNRKNEEKAAALIQVEVLLPGGKQKYVSTGLKVPGSEWDPGTRQVVNTPLATRMNKQISDLIAKIRDHELKLVDSGRLLTAEEVDVALERAVSGDFPAFIERLAGERKGIAYGTKSLHLRTATNLRDCGIVRYHDLTYANIVRFDQHLKGKLTQTSVAKQHQVVKHYVDEAARQRLIPFADNPYLTFKIERGKHKIRIRLDDEEIKRLVAEPVSVTRDLAVFQLFTGLAHKDMAALTERDNLRRESDGVWLEGLRKKSGELYTIPLLPDALEIIDRYKGGATLLPCPQLYDYNRNLKLLAASAKIGKKLSSYTLRHTYASWLLNKGVPITSLKELMGHTQINTTMVYAKLVRETVRKDLLKAFHKSL